MKTYSLLIFVAILLSEGCVTKQSTVFNAADFAPYEADGSAVIQGHAFVRTEDNAKHNAAGLPVYLMPLTPYTQERANIMMKGGEPEEASPGLSKYVKSTTADMGGRYTFTGLPTGSYVVYSKIEWSHYKRSGGSYYAVGKVTVKNGENRHLVVCNPAL